MSDSAYKMMVNYLRSYKSKEMEIETYQTKMYGVKAISYSNEEKAMSFGKDNPMNFYIEKIGELQQDLIAIQELVDKLEGNEKLVIFGKFIRGVKLEVVAKEINYSLVHTRRFYSQAIYRLIDIVNEHDNK